MMTIGLKAQLTPEAWIASFPGLPSISQIISEDKAFRYPDNKDPEIPLKDFLDSVEGVIASGSAALGKIRESDDLRYKNGIYAEKVPGTNVTNEQLAHMSREQQQKVAKNAAAGTLAQYGLSEADIKKMQSGKLSKAEEEAIANKMMQNMTGGMSVDDIKFMENMTEKERVEFMQLSGLAESTQAKSAADKKTKKVSSATARKIETAMKEVEFTTRRVREHAELSAVVAQGQKTWEQKYEAKDNALFEEINPLAAKYEELYNKQASKGELEEVANKILQVKREIWENENAFYAEYIPLYHRAVGDMLDYIRGSMMSSYRNLKGAYDAAYKETGNPQWLLGESQITLPAEYYGFFLGAIADYKRDSFFKVEQMQIPAGDISSIINQFSDDAQNARDTDGNPYDTYQK